MARVYGEFFLENGSKLVLRSPRWEDLDDLTKLINSLVEEGAPITMDRIITREEEAEWLAGRLANIEKGRTIMVVAEVNGKVIGNSETNKLGGIKATWGFSGSLLREKGIGG